MHPRVWSLYLPPRFLPSEAAPAVFPSLLTAAREPILRVPAASPRPAGPAGRGEANSPPRPSQPSATAAARTSARHTLGRGQARPVPGAAGGGGGGAAGAHWELI